MLNKGAYQKADGKWYFEMFTEDPKTNRWTLRQEFGPYDSQGQAEHELATADAVLG